MKIKFDKKTIMVIVTAMMMLVMKTTMSMPMTSRTSIAVMTTVISFIVRGYVSAHDCSARNWNCVFQRIGTCSEAEVSVCNGKHGVVIDAKQVAGPSFLSELLLHDAQVP